MHKRSPLHWAAFSGHVDLVEVLLEQGAAIDARNASGQTPLHWAITEQQLEKVLRQLEPPLGFRGDHKSYFEMDEQVHIY